MAGRLVETTGPHRRTTHTYDPNSGQLAAVAVTVDGRTVTGAVVGYEAATGRMSSVAYRGGNISLRVGYDLHGRRSSVTFSTQAPLVPARIAGHEVTYSPAGRQREVRIDTGGPGLVDPNPAGDDFAYDGAGRLTQAWLVGGRADYSWDQPLGGDCSAQPGFNSAAGRNTNRTRSSFTPTGGTPTTTHACYNTADQLVSTTTGTATTSYRYDQRGNQVADGQDLYSWDAADRLTAITAPGATVTYTRDALDRPVSRQQGTTITRYAYSGFDDTPVAVLDASGTTIQELVRLPGGVLATVGLPGLAETLSFPDLTGNYITSTGTTGDPVGPRAHYDPWGARQPAGPAIDNTSGAADFAAYGAHGKLNEHATTKPLVLMGARPLSPTHGRFLTVDPIEGGCANNYVYVYGDPVNTTDLTGKAKDLSCWGFAYTKDGLRYEGGISKNTFTVNITPTNSNLAIFAYDAYIDYDPASFGARRHVRADGSSGNPLVLQSGVVVAPGGRIKAITIAIQVVSVDVPTNSTFDPSMASGFRSSFATFSCVF